MLWAVVAIAVDRKAATVVDDKGTPLHGRGKNLLQSLVDVLAQVREGLGSIGEAIVVSVGIHSEQNVVGLLSLLSPRTTGISEGVFSEEVLNLVEVAVFGAPGQVSCLGFQLLGFLVTHKSLSGLFCLSSLNHTAAAFLRARLFLTGTSQPQTKLFLQARLA